MRYAIHLNLLNGEEAVIIGHHAILGHDICEVHSTQQGIDLIATFYASQIKRIEPFDLEVEVG